jgi:hypothetical protein
MGMKAKRQGPTLGLRMANHNVNALSPASACRALQSFLQSSRQASVRSSRMNKKVSDQGTDREFLANVKKTFTLAAVGRAAAWTSRVITLVEASLGC